ncbi:hypothetical protein Ciccas_010029 [Cichlidogyrus casuarinus]|uniref:Uncharacterized protein n=1 Tax=Cichlidogyrus casuarinus TaxID=1844966 RepID=A0ABD2PVC8_9PLAT
MNAVSGKTMKSLPGLRDFVGNLYMENLKVDFKFSETYNYFATELLMRSALFLLNQEQFYASTTKLRRMQPSLLKPLIENKMDGFCTTPINSSDKLTSFVSVLKKLCGLFFNQMIPNEEKLEMLTGYLLRLKYHFETNLRDDYLQLWLAVVAYYEELFNQLKKSEQVQQAEQVVITELCTLILCLPEETQKTGKPQNLKLTFVQYFVFMLVINLFTKCHQLDNFFVYSPFLETKPASKVTRALITFSKFDVDLVCIYSELLSGQQLVQNLEYFLQESSKDPGDCHLLMKTFKSLASVLISVALDKKYKLAIAQKVLKRMELNLGHHWKDWANKFTELKEQLDRGGIQQVIYVKCMNELGKLWIGLGAPEHQVRCALQLVAFKLLHSMLDKSLKHSKIDCCCASHWFLHNSE